MTNNLLSNIAIFVVGIYVGQEYQVVNIKHISIKILKIIKESEIYKEINKK